MSPGAQKSESSAISDIDDMATVKLVQAMPDLVVALSQRADSELGHMLGDWAEQWLKAWNNHDVNGVTALVTEDIVYDDPSMFGQQIIGKSDFGAFLNMFWRAFPDAHFEISGTPYLALLGVGTAVPYRVTGTFTGEMYGPTPLTLAPTGRRADLRGVDLYEFRDGLLCHWVSIIDGLALAQQLGLAPQARGPLFNFAMKLQRLTTPVTRRLRGV